MRAIFWFISRICFVFCLAAVVVPAGPVFALGDAGRQFSQGHERYPELSLVLGFYYMHRDIEDERLLDAHVPNLLPDVETAGINEKGFSLGYAEFVCSAEPYRGMKLFGNIVFNEDDSSRVQEAYAGFYGFASGFYIDAGRFLSGFTLLNRSHAHEWNFFDLPLPYIVFFGRDQLVENGVRLGYKFPTEFELNIGLEILEGANEISFGTGQVSNNATERVMIAPASGPNLYVAFVDGFVSGEVIDTGFFLSGGFGQTRVNNDLQSASGSALEATTIMVGTGISVTYFMDTLRFVSFEAEFIMRNMRGTFFEPTQAGRNTSSVANSHYGVSAQVTAQPIPRLGVGVRGSTVISRPHFEGDYLDSWATHTAANPVIGSAMVSWTLNRYSRVRLQYNYDISKYDKSYSMYTIQEVAVDCVFLFGPHGRFL